MKNQLLIDVNLAKISFSKNGVSITLDFIDMYKGLPFTSINCDPAISFQFQNMFEPEDELPCYITEVCLSKIPNAEITTYLKSHGYIFVSDSFSDRFSDLYLLSVIGGEAEIYIICSTVKEKRSDKNEWTAVAL